MQNKGEPANRNSWKACLPLPASREKLNFQCDYSKEEYGRISLGLIPEAMEDKWFIFMENNVLYLHRSWTGICVYEVHFVRSGDRYSVKEAWVNRDDAEYKGKDSDSDNETLRFLIGNFLFLFGSNTPRLAAFPISY